MAANALEDAWKKLDPSGAPMLWSWRQEVSKTKPYKGLRVYHNTPLSIETVCKVDALLAAGAHVVVSSPNFLIPATFSEARDLIDRAGLEFRADKHASDGEFDFYLDCCAELSDLPPPTYGAVELTRTGALAYESKRVPYPILSVDDSRLKELETFNGTGEAFMRAFKKLSKRDAASETFALLGYGKVGQGVAYQIQQAGGRVLVFDIDQEARNLAVSHGFGAYKPANTAISEATVVITATGQRDILKKAIPQAEKRLAGKILCNIGADDEICEGFNASEILANGATINFTLRHPTTMRYLDPSFYAHNLCIQLLQDEAYGAGFHPFPDQLDKAIIDRWSKIHNEPYERPTPVDKMSLIHVP